MPHLCAYYAQRACPERSRRVGGMASDSEGFRSGQVKNKSAPAHPFAQTAKGLGALGFLML
jgi:hypothetical protein